ncbi:MAG TPA: YkuS family protein [Bacillota bacterium]
MAKGTVAVAPELTPVRRALEERGYQVVTLDEAFGRRLEPLAVVVSGVDENVGGDATRRIEAPVIEARGRSAEDVVAEVERKATISMA